MGGDVFMTEQFEVEERRVTVRQRHARATADDKEIPVVYVVQQRDNHNVLPALDFGRLELVLDADSDILFNGDAATLKVEAKLYRYRKEDYLIPIGDPVAIAIATTVAARATGGHVTLLKWDKQERLYYPVKIFVDLKKPGTNA